MSLRRESRDQVNVMSYAGCKCDVASPGQCDPAATAAARTAGDSARDNDQYLGPGPMFHPALHDGGSD
jgi:hypothetical protein